MQLIKPYNIIYIYLFINYSISINSKSLHHLKLFCPKSSDFSCHCNPPTFCTRSRFLTLEGIPTSTHFLPLLIQFSNCRNSFLISFLILSDSIDAKGGGGEEGRSRSSSRRRRRRRKRRKQEKQQQHKRKTKKKTQPTLFWEKLGPNDHFRQLK